MRALALTAGVVHDAEERSEDMKFITTMNHKDIILYEKASELAELDFEYFRQVSLCVFCCRFFLLSVCIIMHRASSHIVEKVPSIMLIYHINIYLKSLGGVN